MLAVSVDPKGDTPSAVRHFIAVHRLLPEFLYLTGTVKQLAAGLARLPHRVLADP